MKTMLSLAALLAAILSVAQARAGDDTTTMLPLDARQAAALAALVKADEQAGALWRDILSLADTSLGREPKPLENIIYEGRLDTDPQRVATVESLRDMFAIQALALTHVITGEASYAQAARRYIHAWTIYRPTGNPINENKLAPLIAAYANLRDGFEPQERQTIDTWLRAMAEAAKKPTHLNNWNAKRIKVIALIGAALGDTALKEFAVSEYKAHVQAALMPDGTSVDLRQRDALSYHNGGLTPLVEIAILLEPDGLGLYDYESPSGASLRGCVEYVIPFADGRASRAEFVHTTVELDRRRAAAGLDFYQPGKPFAPEQALELLDLASYFRPEYAKLASRIRGVPEARFSDWQQVINAAMRPAK